MKLHLDQDQLIEALQDFLDAKLINSAKKQRIVSIDVETGGNGYKTDKIEITTADVNGTSTQS